MPDIDVSDIINDPDFADCFTVTSTSRSMATGVPVDSADGPFDGSGVVIPGKSNLRRLDDGSRIAAYIDIWTQYSLTAGWKADDTTSQLADIVTWKGRRYTVAAVEDYSNYGSGFLKVSADLLDLNPSAPE